MQTSNSIVEISKALVAFQSEIEAVHTNAVNPFFNSNYADLQGMLASIKPTMAVHGLAAIQSADEGNGVVLVVTTRIIHSTGEWIECAAAVGIEKQTPQGYGSAISYGRRYGLQAALGLSVLDEEDDGGNGTGDRGGAAISDDQKAARAEWYKMVKSDKDIATMFKTLRLSWGDGDKLYEKTVDGVEGMTRKEQFFAAIREQHENTQG